MLNALTGAGVRAEHRLFATLDPTTRKLELPAGRELLLTDTVGFIQKLPTDLVAAFRATLEEVTEADLIVQVLDAELAGGRGAGRDRGADPGRPGRGDKPRVVALNKVDLLGPASRRRAIGALSARYPGAVPISATKQTGFADLLDAMDQASRGDTSRSRSWSPTEARACWPRSARSAAWSAPSTSTAAPGHWGWVPRHAGRRFEAYQV